MVRNNHARVDDYEIKLTLVKVGAGYADTNLVAEAEHDAAAPAAQTVVLLVEIVEIVGKLAHRHETLAFIVVELHIEAPLGHTGNHAFVFLAEMVAHILHLLVFYRRALGIRGELLHSGGVFALVLEFFDVDAAASGQIALEQTVNHHVGIAADGRGKVGIVVESEAVVAYILGCVDGFGHGAYGEHGEEIFLTLTLYVPQHFVERTVDFAGRAVGLQPVAESAGDIGQVGELCRIGLIVHAIYESLLLAALLRLADGGGHRAVGQEHELLDELIGIFRHLEIYARGMAFLVDVETHLLAVEVHRAVFESLRAELLGQTVERGYLLHKVALAVFDHFLGLLVGETAVRADHGAHDAAVEHLCVVVKLKNSGESQLLLVGTQRADAVAEALGEHRHHAVHKVYRCCARHGLAIDYGVGLHIVSYVGDMHPHLPVAVGEASYRERVVEILGILGVDCEGCHAAEILAAADLLGSYTRVDFVGSLFDGGGIFIWEAVFGQNGVNFGIVLAGSAEDIDHLAARIFHLLGPFGDFNDGLVAIFATLEFGLRDKDVAGEKFGIGLQESEMAFDLKCSDKHLLLGLDDFHHLRLRLLAAAMGGDGNSHAVAVESVHRIALGHEDCLLVVVGHHTVLAVGATHERAHGKVGARRSLVFARCGLHQLAVESQFGEHHGYAPLRGGRFRADCGGYLLIVERIVLLARDKILNLRPQLRSGCFCRCVGHG